MTPTNNNDPRIHVVQLNTRIAHPYKDLLHEQSRTTGKTIRSLIEEALDSYYGTPPEMKGQQ